MNRFYEQLRRENVQGINILNFCDSKLKTPNKVINSNFRQAECGRKMRGQAWKNIG